MIATDALRLWAATHLTDEHLYTECMNIADDIDEDYFRAFNDANFPLDKNNIPCKLDDVVWYDGDKMLVVAISHKGSVNIRDFGTNNPAFWVKAKHVTHEEPDSQEKIYEDMMKICSDYARMQLSDAYCIELAIKNLLYRQQALDGKEVALW